jgi:hypothetical protein
MAAARLAAIVARHLLQETCAPCSFPGAFQGQPRRLRVPPAGLFLPTLGFPCASHSRALACANVHPVRSWGDTAARPRPQGKRRNPSLADELVAIKLDRLSRSTRDVYNPVYNLGAKGAAFTALELSFLTKDARGRSL